MTLKITLPQSVLLDQLIVARERGVFKDTRYTPAELLVRDGLAKWAQKYHNSTGKLVVTAKGLEFRGIRQ